MVSEWQKKYFNEAKEIIKNSCEEYKNISRSSKILEEKLCEKGTHNSEGKIAFCKICRSSFCDVHGNMKEGLCNECREDF